MKIFLCRWKGSENMLNPIILCAGSYLPTVSSVLEDPVMYDLCDITRPGATKRLLKIKVADTSKLEALLVSYPT